MCFRHLIEDAHSFTALGVVDNCQFNAAYGIANMDEGTGLPSGPVHCQRMTYRGLHQKSIQDSPEIPVVIEAIDQSAVQLGLCSVRAPDDSLVEVGDTNLVILVVVGEQQLIHRLGQVIDAAGIGGMKDFTRFKTTLDVHVDQQITFGNNRPLCAVAVNTHSPQMHQMDVELTFDNGA